ncbi:MAG: carbohydrate-binding protein [Bacteroidales bacterium]|nr:carbohydrate-binding protein [Bacteroidales bacterium]
MKGIITGVALICISFTVFPQTKSTKKGIAYGYHYEEDFEAIQSGISWWYNWYVTPDAEVADVFESYDIDFVPMIWNGYADTAALRDFLEVHPGVKYILGFNEPNFTAQANMTPAQAAEKWPVIEALADDFDLEIVGPALNYCGGCVDIPGTDEDSDPIVYLDAFFDACPDCRVDHLAVHWYACDAGSLSWFVGLFKKYNKPIWVTEFACWENNPTLEDQKGYLFGALDYLESDTSVFRYSWFTGDRTGGPPYIDIYGPDPGELTELGELYVNFNPVHDTNIYTPIPARIEAENYSLMYDIALEGTQDFDGSANVGWIDAGDWLQFNIDVPEDNDYYIYLRLASVSSTTVEIREEDMVLATYNIPGSGGYQKWETYVQQVHLTAGYHKIKVYAVQANFNINWITFTIEEDTAPTVFAGEDFELTLSEEDNQFILVCTSNDADGDSLRIRWSKVGGPAAYTLDQADNDTAVVTISADGAYLFKAEVSDSIYVASDNVRFTVSGFTSLNSLNVIDMHLFPNPVSDNLYIESDNVFLSAVITICDFTGKELISQNVQPGKKLTEIDCSRLSPGIYMVKIVNQNKSRIYGIVKQ